MTEKRTACPECKGLIGRVLTFGPDDFNRLMECCLNERCIMYLQEYKSNDDQDK
jgi:hypothetical protein